MTCKITICPPAHAAGLMKRSTSIFDDEHFEQTVGAALALDGMERNNHKKRVKLRKQQLLLK